MSENRLRDFSIVELKWPLYSSRISQGSQNVIARTEATKQSPHQKIVSLSLAMTGTVTLFKKSCEIWDY